MTGHLPLSTSHSLPHPPERPQRRLLLQRKQTFPLPQWSPLSNSQPPCSQVWKDQNLPDIKPWNSLILISCRRRSASFNKAWYGRSPRDCWQDCSGKEAAGWGQFKGIFCLISSHLKIPSRPKGPLLHLISVQNMRLHSTAVIEGLWGGPSFASPCPSLFIYESFFKYDNVIVTYKIRPYLVFRGSRCTTLWSNRRRWESVGSLPGRWSCRWFHIQDFPHLVPLSWMVLAKMSCTWIYISTILRFISCCHTFIQSFGLSLPKPFPLPLS